MTDIDLVKQLKNDITNTCDAYKADVNSDDGKLAINAIEKEASRTAQAAIVHLTHIRAAAMQKQQAKEASHD